MSEPQLPQSLLRVLAPLTEWFKDQHVSYAIIGGAAIGFLAQPRATQDIDAVTWLDLAETATFVASGARSGAGISGTGDGSGKSSGARTLIVVNSSLWLAFSLISKRHERVDLRRAPRRQVTCRERHAHQHQHNSGERQRVGRADIEE